MMDDKYKKKKQTNAAHDMSWLLAYYNMLSAINGVKCKKKGHGAGSPGLGQAFGPSSERVTVSDRV